MVSCSDHPVIANMERTGYPNGQAPVYPHCPICGAECETIYLDREKNIIGCDCCVTSADACQQEECFVTENDLEGVLFL